MSDDLAAVLGSTIASLIKVGDSKSPEEAGQNLEQSMNTLLTLKEDTSVKKALVDLGKFVGKMAKGFNDTVTQLHNTANTPEAKKMCNDFIVDPNIFFESIPSQFRFSPDVTRNLADAYDLRSQIIRTNGDKKLLGMLTRTEMLTILLLNIRKLWEDTQSHPAPTSTPNSEEEHTDEDMPPLEDVHPVVV